MEINQHLHEQLHEAMKAQDDSRKSVIRMILSSLKLAEVAKGEKLNDAEFLQLIQKEIKTRNETIADAEKAQREDLINKAKAEIEILETYLPKQLSTEELDAIVDKVVIETGAATLKDMGRVLKVLLPELSGRASNALASERVKARLEQGG